MPGLLGLSEANSVLVVAAHPDDETLGLGGTIAAFTGAGIEVDVLVIACLTGPMYLGVSDAADRAAEFAAACDALGVLDAGRSPGPTMTGQRRPGRYLTDLVTLIEAGPGPSLAATRPAALFVPAGGHHQDHDVVCRAALAAARPGGCAGRPVPRLVAGYDGPEDRAWLALGQSRPLAVDTSAAWPAKRKALECYPSQLRPAPHPRSIEKIHAMDQAAGAVTGTETAETFALYRMVG